MKVDYQMLLKKMYPKITEKAIEVLNEKCGDLETAIENFDMEEGIIQLKKNEDDEVFSIMPSSSESIRIVREKKNKDNEKFVVMEQIYYDFTSKHNYAVETLQIEEKNGFVVSYVNYVSNFFRSTRYPDMLHEEEDSTDRTIISAYDRETYDKFKDMLCPSIPISEGHVHLFSSVPRTINDKNFIRPDFYTDIWYTREYHADSPINSSPLQERFSGGRTRRVTLKTLDIDREQVDFQRVSEPWNFSLLDPKLKIDGAFRDMESTLGINLSFITPKMTVGNMTMHGHGMEGAFSECEGLEEVVLPSSEKAPKKKSIFSNIYRRLTNK